MCDCDQTKPYQACCGRLHQGGKAKRVQTVMRARYSAFVRVDINFLRRSHDPVTRPADGYQSLLHDNPNWQQLEVIAYQQSGSQGWVEFKAHYIDEQGRYDYLHERSRFRRREGVWRYVDGEFLA